MLTKHIYLQRKKETTDQMIVEVTYCRPISGFSLKETNDVMVKVLACIFDI